MKRLLLTPIALALACGESAAPRDVLAELGAAGPYAVGYRSMPVSYPRPDGRGTRTVEVLVWYPAEPARGDHPLYVLRASERAVIDAPPLELGPLPVVVFSHGHQAYASVMSTFMEHLASHGFLAVAPMHTGNTFADGGDRETDIYYLRAHDLRAALDAVGPVGPALVMGHSFGGYTAYASAGASYDVDRLSPACGAGTGPAAFCSTFDEGAATLFRAGLGDARYRGVFALDSGDFDLFGASGVAAVHLPVLHMVAEESVAGGDAYWGALSATPRSKVLLKGGAHNDFTDSCAAGAMIRCSALPPAKVLAMVDVMGLAFTRSVLLGDEGVRPVLTGELPVSELVTTEAR